MGWGKNGGGKGTSGGDVGQGAGELQDWTCPINWCGYRNFARRARCRMCEAFPSEGRRLKGGGKGKGNGNQTFAQQQTALAKAHARHQKKEDSLRKELAEVKKQRDAAMGNKAGGTVGGDEGEEDEAMDDGDSEDVEKALALARKKRKALQDAWEDDDPLVQNVEAEIRRLTKKRDEAKPQRVRLRILERKVDRCQKQVDNKSKTVDELDERIRNLQAERDEHAAALASATKELEDARAERTAELQRAIEEESKGGSSSTAAPETDGTAAGKALGVLLAETRARLPGAGEEVSRAVEGAIGQLVALLSKLPAAPPPQHADAPAAAPAAGAGGSPKPPLVVNFQKAAEDRATASDQQRAVAAAARESASAETQGAAAAAVAVGPEPAGGGGDGGQSEGSDDETDGDDSICQMQLDCQENETEHERNARVAKTLKERARAKKARIAEGREHRRNRQGGTTARRIRDSKVKGAA